MPIVDRTVDAIKNIDDCVKDAKTFGEVLTLADQRFQLQQQVDASFRQFTALAGSWKFAATS